MRLPTWKKKRVKECKGKTIPKPCSIDTLRMLGAEVISGRLFQLWQLSIFRKLENGPCKNVPLTENIGKATGPPDTPEMVCQSCGVDVASGGRWKNLGGKYLCEHGQH